MHEIKIKGSLFTWLKYALAILLGAGVVLSSATPVLASSQSVGPIDSDSIDMANMNASISTVSSVYVPENSTKLSIPVYLNFSNTTLWQNYTYLSGYVLYGATPNVFGVYTGGSTQVVRTYFTPLDDRSIYAIWLEGNSLRVYFDNARIDSHSSSSGYVLIGYMNYEFDPAPTGFTYFPPLSGTNTITPNGYVRGTAYEYGFVESIVYAIDHSAAMQDIFDILNDIDTNTGYLPEIFTELQTRLPQLYSLIQQVWNTDQAILSVNQSTYTTVLSILAILQNAYAPQESQAEQVADDVEQGLGQLEMDLSVTMPSGVADLSDDYIAQIDTTYNASVFNMLFNPTLVLMLCICFALAILSYMLYGGK